MFCKQCGTQISDTARFCKQCGAKVTAGKEGPVLPRCACGEPMKPGAKFCKKCGAPLTAGSSSAKKPVSAEKKSHVRTHAEESAKGAALQARGAATAYATEKAVGLLSGMTAAQAVAGECALPMELNPFDVPIVTKDAQRLPALLGGSIKSFFSNLLGIFKSKRKLITLLILGAVLAAVNILKARRVDSELLDLLYKFTAADGSIGNGMITKGFTAALVFALFGERGFFKKLFCGIGQFFSSFGKGKGSLGGFLLGLGAALLLCRFMGVGDIAPVVLPISGVLLALRSLGSNGCIRKILGAILPKKTPAAASVLSGWALGFGLAIPINENAVLVGGVCFAAGFVFSILFRGRKEAVKA